MPEHTVKDEFHTTIEVRIAPHNSNGSAVRPRGQTNRDHRGPAVRHAGPVLAKVSGPADGTVRHGRARDTGYRAELAAARRHVTIVTKGTVALAVAFDGEQSWAA